MPACVDPRTGVGLAPNLLAARLSLELNMLDAVSESLLQASNVEWTRAVSVAQQETVALAQILKVAVCLLTLEADSHPYEVHLAFRTSQYSSGS